MRLSECVPVHKKLHWNSGSNKQACLMLKRRILSDEVVVVLPDLLHGQHLLVEPAVLTLQAVCSFVWLHEGEGGGEKGEEEKILCLNVVKPSLLSEGSLLAKRLPDSCFFSITYSTFHCTTSNKQSLLSAVGVKAQRTGTVQSEDEDCRALAQN